MKWPDQLRFLQAHAHAVTIEVNEHRTVYESAKDALAKEDVDEDVRAACIRMNHVVIVHCYPSTPVGFYRVVHFEIESAVERMYELVREELGMPRIGDEKGDG